MYITYKPEKQVAGLQAGVPRGIICEISPQEGDKPLIAILCRHCCSQLQNKMFIQDMLEACKICGVLELEEDTNGI